MFLPLELLEVLLLSVVVVDAPNAIVVAIEGGENGRTEKENICRKPLTQWGQSNSILIPLPENT